MSDIQVGSLLERTRRLLGSTDQTYLEIYNATGLNPNWLSKLHQGAIADPSVNKVQKLYEYLSSKKLTV